MEEAVAGRFVLTLQPAAHGDMSKSSYRSVEVANADSNSDAEKTEEIAHGDMNKQQVY
jgi:hypothetical protein